MRQVRYGGSGRQQAPRLVELIALKQYGNRYDDAVAKLRQSALDQALENGGWGSSVAGGVAASLLKATCQ